MLDARPARSEDGSDFDAYQFVPWDDQYDYSKDPLVVIHCKCSLCGCVNVMYEDSPQWAKLQENGFGFKHDYKRCTNTACGCHYHIQESNTRKILVKREAL